MKVAFVEDDPDYRLLLTGFLEDQGYQVDSAERPGMLDDKRIESYDAFIMDVMIENDRTAGIDFIYNMQQHLRPEALVIFISNFGRDSQEIQTRLEQVKQFREYQWLDKPIDLVSLGKILRSKAEG